MDAGFAFSEIRLFAGYLLLMFGMFDLLLAMIGLIRFPDIYNRLHATTKIATLGAFFVLLSVIVRDGLTPMGIKSLAVGLFLLLTSPAAGHMMGRAAFNMGIRPCEQTVVDVNVQNAPSVYKDDNAYHEGSYVQMDPEGRMRDKEGRYNARFVKDTSREVSDMVADIVSGELSGTDRTGGEPDASGGDLSADSTGSCGAISEEK